MKPNLKPEVERALQVIRKALDRDDRIVNNLKIFDIIDVCEKIDRQYRELCDGIDEVTGDEIGTAYAEGVNTEFYIEAADWHKISMFLREVNNEGR